MPGVPGEEAGGVGQQDQQPGIDQMGDQCGQPVVVAEADLLVRHGVVFVDDRDHAELEESPERLAGMEVLAAVDEVERGEQDLSRQQSMAAQRIAPHPHQQVLAHGGHCLEGGQVRGAGSPWRQCGPSGGDSTRCDDHHMVPVTASRCHLGRQLVDRRSVDTAVRGGHR